MARGLGYENPNVFEDPESVASLMGIIRSIQELTQDEFRRHHPDHIPVTASRVISGETLAHLAGAANATLLNCDEQVSDEAKRQAAGIFDFLRDLTDGYDDLSFGDRLNCAQELNAMLHDLEQLGVWIYTALRRTKMVGENWADKTPMSVTIGYLNVVPHGRSIKQLMIPRRLS